MTDVMAAAVRPEGFSSAVWATLSEAKRQRVVAYFKYPANSHGGPPLRPFGTMTDRNDNVIN